MTGTLIERLEAVVERLEAMETDARAAHDTLCWKFTLPVLRADGMVKYHWTHPSFESHRLHADDDRCDVLTTAAALERLNTHIAFG